MAEISISPKEPVVDKSYQVLSIVGEIDRDTLTTLKEQMEAFLVTFTQTNLILDLSQLEFTNSEGIGYITDVYNRLTAQSKKVIISSASVRIMDIFNLVGLNSLITCFNSEEEAVTSL